jgi:hypothetical protein
VPARSLVASAGGSGPGLDLASRRHITGRGCASRRPERCRSSLRRQFRLRCSAGAHRSPRRITLRQALPEMPAIAANADSLPQDDAFEEREIGRAPPIASLLPPRTRSRASCGMRSGGTIRNVGESRGCCLVPMFGSAVREHVRGPGARPLTGRTHHRGRAVDRDRPAELVAEGGVRGDLPGAV